MTLVQDQIVRTYSGPTRDAALDAYRADATRALAGGFAPISHRWTEGTSGPTLIGRSGMSSPRSRPRPKLKPRPSQRPCPSRSARAREAAAAQEAAPEAPAEPADAADETPAPTGVMSQTPSDRAARLTVQVLDLHCAGEPLRWSEPASRRYPTCPSSTVDAGSATTPITFDARSCTSLAAIGHVWRDPAADIATTRTSPALHAQRGLQHDVRPRHRSPSRPALIEEGPYRAACRKPRSAARCRPGWSRQRRRCPQARTAAWVRGVRFTNVPSYLRPIDIRVSLDGAAVPPPITVLSATRIRWRLLRHRRRAQTSGCGWCPSSHRRC